jgi:acyl-CoA thioesterase-1
MRTRAASIGVVLGLVACAPGGTPSIPASPSESGEALLRYVALGDSYTIGTSVAPAASWPSQLVARLAQDEGGSSLELVANLGVNGYTSADLIRDELPRLNELQPEFVTLQIGVNDVVQGVPESAYGENTAQILDDLRGRLPATRILCVATPDYTLTPMGAAFGDPAQQRAAIIAVNRILEEACEVRAIRFVGDVFPMSQRVAEDPSLVTDDGLHPSGAQYALWVDAIAPIMRELLRR